ncbi:MAG: acyltransferase [Treponema sp.]|nr:acyltransferase [Treponema sp.]
MYKPYKSPVNRVFPDIKLPEPRISMFVVFLLRVVTRIYLLLFYGITHIVSHKEKTLFESFQKALAGKSRCIIAFRHPNGGEPQLLTWYFLFKLRFNALRNGIRFCRWPHAVFVYGYEVVRWGGWVARFIMPNVGAMPIYHSKMDSKGMARIYKAISDGRFPLAIAPEGQVSYTADTIPRLEPGVIRIGFQAAVNMEKTNPGCPVEILPLSIHFRYGPWGKGTVELLLRYTEKLCGFTRKETRNLTFIERLLKSREYILSVNEERYKIKINGSETFEERLEKVAYTALETAERMLNIKGEGDFHARIYMVRQICWDRIYLPDIYDLKNMPQIERSTKDIGAGEAWYVSRHQELADFSWYFFQQNPTEETILHNKIEFSQNLHDFASRTMGGAYSNRVSIFPRKVIIKTAPVINLTERLPSYREDRRAAISNTLKYLENAYIDNINEMNRMEKG